MIDYKTQAEDIIVFLAQHDGMPLEEASKHIEDRLRKIGHTERMSGYLERQREEELRHDKLRAELSRAREQLAQRPIPWSNV